MYAAFGKLPYQPCLNCPEEKLTLFGSLTYSLYIIQNPFKLCAGEIRVYDKACLLAYSISKTFVLE